MNIDSRTGKRTKAGALEDGRRSVIRYFKNNFADGFRQDSLDLFVGNYKVSPTEGVTHECPLVSLRADQRYLAYPVALALSLAMFILSLVVPSELSTEILLGLLFWAGKRAYRTTLFIDPTQYSDVLDNYKTKVINNKNFLAMIFVTSRTVLKNGPDYVDQPHLVHAAPHTHRN